MMGHRCCNKQKVKRGLWSPEEDERLLKHITCHGHGNWSSVPKLAGLQRCGKSCRLRWINYLRPDLKRGSFTPNEEQIIIDVHRILGNRWAQIAKHLPGRTDNEVKNFWNSCIKKKLISQGLDPKTHNLLSPHQRAALNITTPTAAAAAATTTTTTNRPVVVNLHQHESSASSSLLPSCTFDHASNMMSIITMDHHHHIPTLDDSSHHHHHLPSFIGTPSSSNLLQQQISNYANDDDDDIIVDHHHHHHDDEAGGLFWGGSTLDHPAFDQLAAMGPEKEKMAVNIDDDVEYDRNIAINVDDHNYYYYYNEDQNMAAAGIVHNHHEVASNDDMQDRFDDLAFMDPSLVHGAMYAADDDDHFVPMDHDFAWNF